MKTLVIAEKPDMGRNIASAIEPRAINKRTHLEGETYIITWAIGHLIGLAEPDRYDDRYKKWNFSDLPIIPDRFLLLPQHRTKDQLQVIKTLAAGCGRLVNACDAGREGQLIFSYIQQHLRLTQPVKRLWISDLTPETIRRGFEMLKDGTDYEPLTQAARARSEADWLIGMNGSRAFTTKHGELLSVGRVQTPVLAIVYDRQKEIEAFRSQTFYEVEATFSQQSTEYRGLWQGERFTDKAKAEQLAAKVNGKAGRVASYEVKEAKEFPFKLYDLTLLQRESNAKFGFSAKKTLDVAQTLYEKHKVISYPRTNSNYVNEQNIPEMHAAVEALKGTAYDEFARAADKRLVHKANKYVCNPAKVEDHHAILPTKKRASGLSPDEQKIYDLIVRRFLSQFFPPAVYKVHTVMTEVEQELFRTVVKELLDIGWKKLYPAMSADKSAKPKKGKTGQDDDQDSSGGDAGQQGTDEVETDAPFVLDKDLPVHCKQAAAKEKATQPPKPFTEGTLLKAMESAGKSVEDEALREAMKDAGLGTPATRAATIERLKQVGYITMRGKRIDITPKGCAAIELIRGAGVTLLTAPDMTGEWERRLNEIARGQAASAAFMESVKAFTRLIVDKVRVQPRAQRQAFAQPEAAAPRSRSRKGARPAEGSEGDAAAPSRTRTRSGTASDAKAQAVRRNGRNDEGSDAANAGSTLPARARSRGDTAGAGLAHAMHGSDAGTVPASPMRNPRGSNEAPASAVPAYTPIAACPRPGCGGRIFMGRKGYGCSHYKEGCRFVIWKTSFGKTLTDAMVKSLIEKGKTGKLKLQTESGEPYDARILLKDTSTGTLEVEPILPSSTGQN